MRRSTLLILALFVLGLNLYAQKSTEKPAWKFSMQTNTTARSNLTVQNRCSQNHNFQIQPQNVPFLTLSQNQVSVGGGANKDVPVTFNTANMQPKTYRGQLLVICMTCSSEPTCTQDREVLPVIVTVTAPPKSSSKKNPCKDLKKKCDGLLVAWRKAASKAADLQTEANTERSEANKAETKAGKAEEKTRIAEEAAADEESAYRAKVNDKEFHSNDIAYMELMRADNLAAYQSGNISAGEYQRRAKEITPSKARAERLKNKKRLKKEAKKARKEADKKRKAADKAKAKADAAQKKATDAKAVSDSAKKAYEDCIKKVKDECDKIKAEQAKAAAEKKKREEAEAIAKAEEARRAAAAQKQKEAKEARAKAKKEHREYLLDNIKKLGLIDSRAMSKVPGIWDWLPDILETPVSVLLEQQAGVPIPTDTLKALGGLYGIIGKMLDPCTKAGKEKTIERLQEMINPKTGKKYTWGEALKKTDDMCKLLGELRGKLAALKKASEQK